MFIFVTGLLAGPLALVMVAIQVYLGLVLIRLFLGPLGPSPCNPSQTPLEALIDGPREWIHRRLVVWRGQAVPHWVSWAILLTSILAMQVLVGEVHRHLL